MTIHSSILAKTSCTEEPGGLQAMESHRVRQNLATKNTPYNCNMSQVFYQHLPGFHQFVI